MLAGFEKIYWPFVSFQHSEITWRMLDIISGVFGCVSSLMRLLLTTWGKELEVSVSASNVKLFGPHGPTKSAHRRAAVESLGLSIGREVYR